MSQSRNDNARGPGPVPERWLRCPRKATDLFAGKFFAFKAPLDGRFDEQVPLACRFNPEMIFLNCQLKKHRLGLWVDLTRTTRFYSKEEVEGRNCRYVKIECHGHEGAPTIEQTRCFIKICRAFINQNPLEIIGVHCTHGFNRTGFLLISYMVEHMEYSVDMAIHEFAKVRPPGIYKQEYLEELFRRYDILDDLDGQIKCPPLPDWCNEDDLIAMEESMYKRSSGTCKVKEDATFMEGVPGITLITDPALVYNIRKKVKKLSGTSNEMNVDMFPGSQPVSMDKNNIHYIAQKPYMVSWKADGTRYMMLICGEKEVYFLDRNYSVFLVKSMTFLHRSMEGQHLKDTLLDGEMVIDTDGKRSIPRYLVYDVISHEGDAIGAESFTKRLKTINREIIQPREMAKKKGLILRDKEPFSVRQKDFFDLCKTYKLLSIEFSKQLGHEPDGLIFQPVDEPYQCGATPTVLKWKPLAMNSIDFLLEVKKESRPGYANQSVGILKVGSNRQPYGEILAVNKKVRELNGKIVECKFENNRWVILRERVDKAFPNSYDTAHAVHESIKNPITKEDLLAFVEHHGYKEIMGPPIMRPPIKKPRIESM